MILVVTESALARLIQGALERWGYEAAAAGSPGAGVRIAASDRPCLLVADVGPRSAKVLDACPGLPVVYIPPGPCGGHTWDGEVARIQQESPQLLLPYPFTQQDLLAKVQQMIGPPTIGQPPSGERL